MKIFCYMLQSLFLDLSPLIPWLPEWRVSTLPPRCPCRWPAAPPHGTWPRPSRRTRLPLVPTGGRTSACTRCPTCTVLYCTVLYCTVLYCTVRGVLHVVLRPRLLHHGRPRQRAQPRAQPQTEAAPAPWPLCSSHGGREHNFKKTLCSIHEDFTLTI